MNEYYSTEEASKFFGISRRGTAKRLRMLKNIPEAFIGGPYKTSKCFYKKEYVHAFIDRKSGEEYIKQNFNANKDSDFIIAPDAKEKYAVTPLKTLLLVASSPYWFKKFTELTVMFWFVIIILIVGVSCYG